MKNFKKFLQIVFVLVLLVGTFNKIATAAPVPEPTCTSTQTLVGDTCVDNPLSSDKSITAFTFPNEVADNTVITEGAIKDDKGNITGGTIVVTMPSDTDLTNLVPAITANTSFSPNFTTFDFTNPQTYTVTAEDKTTQIYTVTVKLDQTTSSGGGGSSTPPPSSLNVQVQVDVPATCSATDTDGVVHNYGDSSSNSYLAICALEAAIKTGSISNVQLSNKYPSMGLFVVSMNGVSADSNSQYWAIYQNGSYASAGVVLLPVATGDSIMFQLHDFSDKNLGDQVTLNIHSLVSNIQNSGVTGNSISTSGGKSASTDSGSKSIFDVAKALDFLASQQKTNGSFGEDLYTDWSALALASNPKYQDQENKLITYFSTEKLSGNLLTDYERRAMALMTLGLDPYNTNGENYINKIVSSFDGKQFGDVNQDNDDIFALIVLQNAGYTQNDKIMSIDIPFVLNAQNENGSWDNSVDMTGAAMEALSPFNQNEQARPNDPLVGQVKTALTKAENFLKQNQKDDGSWNENASSTAWAIEGILAQGEKIEDWKTTSGNTPLDYLATVQDTDGGIKDTDLNTKIWETGYVVSALSGKTWNQTMQTFKKENLPKIVVATLKKSPTIAEAPKPIVSPADNTSSQNTASVINSLSSSPSTTPSKNWFIRLLELIF